MKTTAAPVPEWLTCCAEPHADEIAMLRDHLAHREREISRLRDRESIAGRERGRRDKDALAAAKKEAWDHCLWAMKTYVLADAKRPIDDLIAAAKVVVANGSCSQRKHELDNDTLRLRFEMAETLSALAKLDDPAAEPTGLVAELIRLRAAMAEQGARLHLEHAAGGSARCGCPGCEMVREVHLHEVPGAAPRESR